MEPEFFNRDLSWLGFNQRVLEEAADTKLSISERLKFLSVFSSNLDEFYSVRVPVIMALDKLTSEDTLKEVQKQVNLQMHRFGSLLEGELVPLLQSNHVQLLYNEPVPNYLRKNIREYFLNRVLAFLQPVMLTDKPIDIKPEHNRLLLCVDLRDKGGSRHLSILNLPTENLSRFYFADQVDQEERIVVFLDDVIKANLEILFTEYEVLGAWSFKITRNSELDLEGEYKGGMARKLEKKLKLRAFGPPTRILFEPDFPTERLDELIERLQVPHANLVSGGHYHNLKDLASIPLPEKAVFKMETWPPRKTRNVPTESSIFEWISEQDRLLHLPYHSYQPVFRLFNEAAMDPDVREIYVTIYRVATDSQILYALMSAANNGKKVTVFVELKARFDEANNLHWSKKLKAAGVRIIYSKAEFKLHAKIALIKRKHSGAWQNFCLLSTGNLNENTARFYTDHLILTCENSIAEELGQLIRYMIHANRQKEPKHPSFHHLLVSPFNLQKRFLHLIEGEIESAKEGKPASVYIKLNNLEEKELICKLYEASNAGVDVYLLVRGICCIIPGKQGLSERIRVRRIVDHYLEHGRIFIFHNQGNPLVFAGSADWMIRNIYHRIEVCFPIIREEMKQEMIRLIDLQWADNEKAVTIGEDLKNIPVVRALGDEVVRSQMLIYESLV
jgi:polyphosphate kinase